VEHVLTHARPADLGLRRAFLSPISSSTRSSPSSSSNCTRARVIHVGVTRSATEAWTAEPLREATAYGVGPKYLICDNDSKFGMGFARLATTSHIEILKTPYHAPRANAICERFLGSVRRECLDHLLILHEKQHEPRAGRVYALLQPGQAAGSASSSRFRSRKPDQCHHHMPVAGSSLSRSWAACIVTLAAVPEFSQRGRSDGLRDARDPSGVTRVILL
jgi:hypothetical protein